jgi:glycosyltransferase involved in cell wall biosynthesis
MKVLIVTQYFWPEYFRVNDLVVELKKKGVEVEVLTSWPNYPKGFFFKDFLENKKNYKYYNGCRIYRVPQISRGSGSNFRLTLNYLSFLICGVIYGTLRVRNKKYDSIITFATSPILVALVSIVIAKFKNIKHFLWVLDLWPNVLHDLNIFKKKSFIYEIFNKIVVFIYRSSNVILCQSLSFKKNIIAADVNLKSKTIYFPSWPEDKFKDYNPRKEINNKEFTILFTGNIGESQNFDLVIKVIQNCPTNINWIVAGEGRDFEKLKYMKLKHKINNLQLKGLLNYDELKKYFELTDALLITLRPGDTFDSTIPGKFQTYLNFKKRMIGFIGGEVNTIINKYNLGLANSSQDPFVLSKLVKNFTEQNSKFNLINFEKKIDYLLRLFSKERLIKKLITNMHSLIDLDTLRVIADSKFINYEKNFIFSGLNLAFMGSYSSGDINITKNYYFWPDGFFVKRLSKIAINKIPGRTLIDTLIIGKNIKKISVLGVLSENSKNYLTNKFGLSIEHHQLPFGNLNDFKKFIPIFKKDEICLLTLPTPKQEILAEYISKTQSYYKIFCIGGGLAMISGDERSIPKKFDTFFFSETVWRLQFETIRRTKRLLLTFIFYIKGELFGKFTNLKLKILNEKF